MKAALQFPPVETVRTPPRKCAAEGCDQSTKEQKPFCVKHVLLSDYAQMLANTHPCKCGCEAVVVRSPGAPGRPAMFSSAACLNRWRRRNLPEVRRKAAESKRRRRAAVLGRACKFCQATDSETSWSHIVDVCEACDRSRLRRRCVKCDGPKTTRGFCNLCDKPSWLVPVVLLDESSDRERTVYRAPGASGYLSICNRPREIPKDGSPLVLTLPAKDWVRTRR